MEKALKETGWFNWTVSLYSDGGEEFQGLQPIMGWRIILSHIGVEVEHYTW